MSFAIIAALALTFIATDAAIRSMVGVGVAFVDACSAIYNFAGLLCFCGVVALAVDFISGDAWTSILGLLAFGGCVAVVRAYSAGRFDMLDDDDG